MGLSQTRPIPRSPDGDKNFNILLWKMTFRWGSTTPTGRAEACALADLAGRWLSIRMKNGWKGKRNYFLLSDHLTPKHGVQEEDVPNQCKLLLESVSYTLSEKHLPYLASRSTWSTSWRLIQTVEQFAASLSSPWDSSQTPLTGSLTVKVTKNIFFHEGWAGQFPLCLSWTTWRWEDLLWAPE